MLDEGRSEHGRTRRPRPETDPITLIAGTLTLAVSAYVLFGMVGSLAWLFALVAVLVGALLLVFSQRSRRDR